MKFRKKKVEGLIDAANYPPGVYDEINLMVEDYPKFKPYRKSSPKEEPTSTPESTVSTTSGTQPK